MTLAWLRCAVIVAIAILTSILEHHIAGPIDRWAVVAAVVQGLVAMRGFLDQSLGDAKREASGGASVPPETPIPKS